jgi:hypothetical protein
VIDSKHYDVFDYESTDELTKKLQLYYDVDAFFGKNLIVPPHLDIPDRGSPMTVAEFSQCENLTCDTILKIFDIDIRKINLEFKQYSSDMVGQHVADITPERNKILVAPVREYHKETSLPIFHGYFVTRMMVDHKVQHLFDDYDFLKTENKLKGDYFCPQIGRDCMQFEPLPAYNYANDLLNYTFYSHIQNAFNEIEEICAFIASLHVAFDYGLFEPQEIIEKIKLSQVGEETTANLLRAVEMSQSNDAGIKI